MDLAGMLELPVLPLRGQVLFPTALIPLTVGRSASLKALDAIDERKLIIILTQREAHNDKPTLADLRQVGTVAVVHRMARPQEEGGAAVAFVQGLRRVRVVEQVHADPYLRLRVIVLDDQMGADVAETAALERNVRDLFTEVVQEAPNLPDDLVPVVQAVEGASTVADFVAATALDASVDVKQEILETLSVTARLRRLLSELVRQREEQTLRNKIRADVTEKIAESQKEFFLREQMKAIRRELGEGEEDGGTEQDELKQKLDEAGLPDEARKQADRELRRLDHIPPASPEYSVARSYLDWMAALPWQKQSDPTGGPPDMVARAAVVLDEDHYDLEKVKERILEYLAVVQLKRDLKGPILCFVGPPGVGKTSLGRSIARATGREFVRISLGGMHDEAEIRGHRRTYIGALPGQILQGLRRAGTRDPVFMLDEVDKLGKDFRGDPASALLEVLDPQQNDTFRDHYLEVPFDLSKVLFITTANELEPIPAPLRDRMEIIELSGYVEEEKIHIASQFLVPRQITEHGLDPAAHIEFTEGALSALVRGYTHEAGVRALEQKIAAVCRKRARQVVSGEAGTRLTVTQAVVRELLGVPRFREESELATRTRMPGVAVALAWTPYGGEILYIEATRMAPGTGSLTITGQVRDVMQESAKAAVSWLRSNASRLGLEPGRFDKSDVHIHVPAGAVPKDGPSAGVVLAAALYSLMSQRAVRPFVALTGEITLGGFVLPVGGIKEKVLAARRAGVKELILPRQNEPDVQEDVPPPLREGITFYFVDTLDEALDHLFEGGVPGRKGSRLPGPGSRYQNRMAHAKPR